MILSDQDWDLVIGSKRELLDVRLRDVIRYRDLVWLFVKRDFVTQYKQTILGPFWFVIGPLFTTIMYTFVFGRLAKIGTDSIPSILFYYSGTMLWSFFNSSFSDASNVFLGNSGLFGKVYFPRLIVPISNVFSNLMRISIQFLFLMCFYIYYLAARAPISPSWWMFALPFLLAWLAFLGTGMGMVISALTNKYRDLKQLVSFAMGLLMYATPVVYPLSQMPAKYSWISFINPLSAPVELFRIWFFGAGNVTLPMIMVSLAWTGVCAVLGLLMFNQSELNFIDVV